ncbi:MAG: hypothetical protein M3N95_02600 [Actinomycetota bacterium]|nr:hypothetical protein [Actinomycetota bacterium]
MGSSSEGVPDLVTVASQVIEHAIGVTLLNEQPVTVCLRWHVPDAELVEVSAEREEFAGEFDRVPPDLAYFDRRDMAARIQRIAATIDEHRHASRSSATAPELLGYSFGRH